MILDAMEHPEHYSTAELEAMIGDPAVKEVLDLIDKTKSSLQTISTPDVQEEWKGLESRHSGSTTLLLGGFRRISSRNVAASVAIAIASFTVVAAVVGAGIQYFFNDRHSDPAPAIEMKADAIAAVPDTIRVIERVKEAGAETVVFDEATLETILAEIASYYGCKVVFNNEKSKSLRLYFRWDKASALEDVTERLNNFQHIRITVDNRTIKVD